MATDVVDFQERIQPRLSVIPLVELMRATGLSKAQCSMIRRGLRAPHPKHWAALTTLIKHRRTDS